MHLFSSIVGYFLNEDAVGITEVSSCLLNENNGQKFITYPHSSPTYNTVAESCFLVGGFVALIVVHTVGCTGDWDTTSFA